MKTNSFDIIEDVSIEFMEQKSAKSEKNNTSH